jgi:hypothetical protein
MRTSIALRFLAPLAFFAAGATGYTVAAWAGGVAPFARHDVLSPREETLRALPFDAPLAYDARLEWAGAGPRLPWMAVWTSDLAPDEVAAQIADHLAGSPKWELTQTRPLAGEFETTLARVADSGLMTHFAVLSVRANGAGSRISFEFTDFAPDS